MSENLVCCIQCLSCLQYCPKQAINMGGVTVNRERCHNPNVSAAELTEKRIISIKKNGLSNGDSPLKTQERNRE